MEILGPFQNCFRSELIRLLVTLDARRVNSPAFCAIKKAKLNPRGIGIFTHKPAERVYLTNNGSLGDASYGGGYYTTSGRRCRDFCVSWDCRTANASRSQGRLNSGMPAPDNNDVAVKTLFMFHVELTENSLPRERKKRG